MTKQDLTELQNSLDKVEMTTSAPENNRYILGVLSIILATLIYGSIFPITKGLISQVSKEVLIAVRFTMAAVVFAPFLRNLNVRLVRDGAILGLLSWCTSVSATFGLETFSANRGAFAFGLSVIFVMLFDLLLGKRIAPRAILGAVLSFNGIGVMFWGSGESLNGAGWLLLCAVFNTAYLIAIQQFVQRHPTVQLVAVSLWMPAVAGLLWAVPELTTHFEAIVASLSVNLSGLIYLVVVDTVVFTWLEMIGQRWVPANEVAILQTLEPLVTAIISFWLLGETFEIHDFIGANMILAAMILIVTRPKIEESSSPVSVPTESVPQPLELPATSEAPIPLINLQLQTYEQQILDEK
ncbi:DMT family transporter [Dolichospermum sp. LEGE 00240]|uniref:SxtPER n=4 Tax=Aphanizomenon TaxID=1175 RepID=A0A1M4BLB9_9CYAN|nr:DMT family transporter [Dolichospermum sp. LEGE 00240]ACZ26223.1 SxtPER [Aphanizomenon sp. NH-5]MDM3845059.1 DMT family transporter [Aphanizomenon gracile PMC638.10]MDM3850935.1 DMT family transporter [Aphanizomenon gracile PMC627.10]SAQ71098.1 SxtPER [Aphanizomenon gracile NIVA-CYA 655]SAQ71154.1 SxtPER [Aphanizomenon gracile NIVA-CYA 851]SAQ71182.1 SxtPER [Aphanizomenon gracile NIVA-CYA 676]